jgi:hypothetical protein
MIGHTALNSTFAPLLCFAEHAQGIEFENRREKSFVTFISFLFSK